MNQLILLKIECEIPGLVQINGGILGETPSENLTRYVSEGRIFLSFTPLASGSSQKWLPFGRMIDLNGANPAITCDDGVVCLYLLPGNVVIVQLYPPYIMTPMLPHNLSTHQLTANNRRYQAEVYYEAGVNFSLSDGQGQVQLVCPLAEQFKQPHIFTRRIAGAPCVFVEGTVGEQQMLFAAKIEPAEFLFLEPYDAYQLGDNGVDIMVDVGHPDGHYLVSHRDFREQGCPISSHDFVPHSDTPQMDSALIGCALAAAVKYNINQGAMGLLSDSLREDLSFEDLRDFFGEIDMIEQGLLPDYDLTISSRISQNTFFVRVFDIELEDGRISNISERE